MQNLNKKINSSHARVAKNLSAAMLLSVFLFGCGSSGNNSKSFEVTVTNLTHAQPFSPVALIMHQEGSLWSIGSPASNALELLAEGGDNSGILAESIVIRKASGTGNVMPGSSQTVKFSFTDDLNGKLFSAVTMLVNTNDAFTGFTGLDVSQMTVGGSKTMNLTAYDSGTEANSEASGTMPGQGGEGFNAARDDTNKVSRHPGVVSVDDGLTSSVLTEAHRFDNPVARVKVTRIR